jgi:hypothetical protein
MTTTAYRVNGRYINSVYLALHECWQTGAELEFYCNDHEYDKHDWTQEPDASLELLMDSYAKQLRNQYQRLILLWSGGTDSHTIYNVFKRNRIHLDEIIIKASAHSAGFPEINHDWIQKNHWDPTTTITRYDDHDVELRALDVPDEDWVWRDKGDLLKYGMTSSGDGVKFLCEKNHAGHTWTAIGGYEKPRLIYRQGRWYSRQLDMVLRPTMGHDYITHFFLEPMIHIKQSHMVKHAVKHLLRQTAQPLYDNDWAEAKWGKDSAGYRDWCYACGRHDEVTHGVSHTQKQYNDALDKTKIDVHGNWSQLGLTHDQRLAHDLANQVQVAVDYVKGFHNIYSETRFLDYLRDKKWFRDNDSCLTSLRFTWSKEYDLGP